MVKMIQLNVVLVLVALASACGASDTGEVAAGVEEQYKLLVEKLKEMTNLDSSKVLFSAGKMYLRKHVPFSRNTDTYTAEEAIALPIWRHYRDDDTKKPIGLWWDKKFERIYNEFVIKPCDDFKRLDEKFESFMSEHKNIDDWRHRHASFPIFWSNTVALCKTQTIKGAREKVYKQFKIYQKNKTE